MAYDDAVHFEVRENYSNGSETVVNFSKVYYQISFQDV